MKYQAQDYSHLFGMNGFSRELLQMHFTLYEGYVEQTNKILETLSRIEKNEKHPEYAGLKRRFGWEFDGMRLHEFYFDNLGGKAPLKKSPLQKALEKEFESLTAWQEDFVATGGLRGIGWAILCYDPVGERLINTWINEHDVGHLAGSIPLLVLDVFEHAFFLDYGVERGKYIEAFIRNIHWELVADRYDVAKQLSVVPIGKS